MATILSSSLALLQLAEPQPHPDSPHDLILCLRRMIAGYPLSRNGPNNDRQMFSKFGRRAERIAVTGKKETWGTDIAEVFGAKLLRLAGWM